jgi:hypothetical protein
MSDSRTSSKRIHPVLIGCGVVIIFSFCSCFVFGAASIGLLSRFAAEPEDLSVEYQMPYTTRVGEEFELILTLRNTGSAPITVDDIDLDQALTGSILDGAIVLASEPYMERDYSIPGIKTYYYKRPILPGATEVVIFKLQAVEAGEFGGSVGVYVGDQSVIVEPVITITE